MAAEKVDLFSPTSEKTGESDDTNSSSMEAAGPISARTLHLQRMRAEREGRERTRFRIQLTPEEIQEDFEHMAGKPLPDINTKKRKMTTLQRIKMEVSFPGSHLEELYKQQVLNKKPRKKGGQGWSKK